MQKTPTPSSLCAQIETDFPGIWARIDKAHPVGKRTSFPVVRDAASRTYPPGTIHPLGLPLRYVMDSNPANRAAYADVISKGVDADSVFVAYSENALQGISAWRTTRLNYEFDADFYDALAATPLKGTPPSEIFQRLPAKAFFLSRKGGISNSTDSTVYHGFFVVVFDDRLLLAPISNNSISGGKFEIRLGQDTVEAALARVCADTLEASISVLQAHPNGTPAEKEQAIKDTQKRWPKHEKTICETLGGTLSCLMYLCTEEPDISQKTVPQSKVMRMGNRVRFTTPKQDTQITVGMRLGSIFRKNQAPAEDAQDSANSGTPLPPHIRRAHWHTYWTGKKSEPKPLLKWLSPILVNATSPEQLAETVHPVKVAAEAAALKALKRAFNREKPT